VAVVSRFSFFWWRCLRNFWYRDVRIIFLKIAAVRSVVSVAKYPGKLPVTVSFGVLPRLILF
jgi:hypothetical protein